MGSKTDAVSLEACRSGVVRSSEWVILGFLVYAGILGLFLHVDPSVRLRVLLLNSAVLVAYALLLQRPGSQAAMPYCLLRDAVSMALVLLAYREMGWFAQPHLGHALESSWMIWDRAVLRGGRGVIESFGLLLPSILEISYGFVYTLAPFGVGMLYRYGHRERADRFLLVFALGVLLCYAQFPFWPSDPPRVLFPHEDLPSYDTIFRRFNLWMLGNYGIHTSVFPSAHVSGAFATAFGAYLTLPEHKWVGRFLLAMASLIAIATVYGRYHYLVDAVAGLGMALLALAVVALFR